MSNEKLLTPKQVASILGVTDACLRRKRWKNYKGRRIKFIKIGNKVRYRQEDVEAYINQCIVDI